MSAKDTKTELMDVADYLVRHKGADGFSYSDLSSVVGIRKASIHHHFPTKADLLTAIMQRYDSRVMEDLEAFSAQSRTVSEKLRRFVSFYRDALNGGDTLCMCVAYTVTHSELAEPTQAAIHTFRSRVAQWLKTRFDEARQSKEVKDLQDPGAEAAALLALVEGAQIATRISGDLASYDAATKLFLDRLQAA
ncbi:TetR/AcrR family transcriptional regulator [Roseibium sediminis]|uniref:TetR/AcrR family transcriptional regulator n=1 Tax=Roseibium sediminis TaxID=1775174 RepID=UPI00123CB6C1|nr:TetR/AcrR family transcriptional regulator [Roseibium sediminis]